MKRFFALMLALLALTMMLTLAACGGEEEAPAEENTQTDVTEPAEGGDAANEQQPEAVVGADLAAVSAQMIADLGISDYIDVATDALANVYGIDTAQVANAAAFNATSSNAFPQEVVMVQAVDEAAAADIAAKLESRLGAIAEQAASYDPASLELAQNCKVITNGSYVGMFFSEQYDAMVAAFQNAVG